MRLSWTGLITGVSKASLSIRCVSCVFAVFFVFVASASAFLLLSPRIPSNPSGILEHRATLAGYPQQQEGMPYRTPRRSGGLLLPVLDPRRAGHLPAASRRRNRILAAAGRRRPTPPTAAHRRPPPAAAVESSPPSADRRPETLGRCERERGETVTGRFSFSF